MAEDSFLPGWSWVSG